MSVVTILSIQSMKKDCLCYKTNDQVPPSQWKEPEARYLSHGLEEWISGAHNPCKSQLCGKIESFVILLSVNGGREARWAMILAITG